ncbi:Lar family restriction alleviation protein [Pseudomonas sp.]|uniref:Lar family restriction alleviation protein n=2 Tax=Pseudomonas TaxID=286 RepID=UPI001D6696BC|nr:Lar family restriction alleviation protein [Pseudomonas sp.]MBS6039950.1 Lar family restriction alleviation protein [Pseudomonas sp.]
MVSELLPCPFCGQQDFLIERLDSDASVVICQGLTGPHEACLARGPVGVAQNEGEEQPGRDKAVELWNARAEQHQGEPVACAHEWTDDGQFMLVCTACGAQEDHDPKWRDMATAPRDGTLVRLLVEFTEHATEDSDAMPSPTIGANSFDHTGEDAWQFAGWSWEQDCFTQGAGEPVGWLPLLDTPHATPGEVERLRLERRRMDQALSACANERDTLRVELDSMAETFGMQEDKIDALRAQLVERDALLREKSGDLIRMAAHLISAPLIALQDLQDEDKKMTRARVNKAVDTADARLKDAAYELRRIADALYASAEPKCGKCHGRGLLRIATVCGPADKNCPDCASAEPSAPAMQIPEGYCVMPRRLTAENGAKALLLGEFKLEVTRECPECLELEEPTEGCEICDGAGEYGQRYTIPWDKIKFIYSEAVKGLALKQ